MQWFKNFNNVKYLLIAIAAVIAAASLYVSHALTSDLKKEELNKMQVWAEAMRSLNSADENTDLNLVLAVLSGNDIIPVVVLDSKGAINNHRNIEIPEGRDSLTVLLSMVSSMRANDHIIRIDMDGDDYFEVCYDDSLLLQRLSYYPYVQLLVVLLFFLICLVAIVSSKRAEQNKVWVGLSKETAHQLGTPISSLMAWSEVLREKYPDDELLHEMGKDINRLQTVAERFSKIGSQPTLEQHEVLPVVQAAMDYMRARTSNKITYALHAEGTEHYQTMLCVPLFEWVIENICKNAIDSMEGKGAITINIQHADNKLYIDITDTGKGIDRRNFKRIFQPGYTSKKRGWGLGLSLGKRIIENYHRGKLFVKQSQLGVGTTFRIVLEQSKDC